MLALIRFFSQNENTIYLVALAVIERAIAAMHHTVLSRVLNRSVHQVIELLSHSLNASFGLVFPWFAIDIGGTLVKLVYFEPLDLTDRKSVV